jgi:hypothetical protein
MRLMVCVVMSRRAQRTRYGRKTGEPYAPYWSHEGFAPSLRAFQQCLESRVQETTTPEGFLEAALDALEDLQAGTSRNGPLPELLVGKDRCIYAALRVNILTVARRMRSSAYVGVVREQAALRNYFVGF